MRKILRKLMLLGIVTSLTAGGLYMILDTPALFWQKTRGIVLPQPKDRAVTIHPAAFSWRKMPCRTLSDPLFLNYTTLRFYNAIANHISV